MKKIKKMILIHTTFTQYDTKNLNTVEFPKLSVKYNIPDKPGSGSLVHR